MGKLEAATPTQTLYIYRAVVEAVLKDFHLPTFIQCCFMKLMQPKPGEFTTTTMYRKHILVGVVNSEIGMSEAKEPFFW